MRPTNLTASVKKKKCKITMIMIRCLEKKVKSVIYDIFVRYHLNIFFVSVNMEFNRENVRCIFDVMMKNGRNQDGNRGATCVCVYILCLLETKPVLGFFFFFCRGCWVVWIYRLEGTVRAVCTIVL